MDGPEYAQLVMQACAGDGDAFGALAAEERCGLIRVAWAVLGDPHEAEDAVQDALVRAFARIDQLRDTASFQPWLRRIALREAQSRLRHLAARSSREWAPEGDATLDSLIATLGDEGDPARVTEAQWTLAEFHAALQHLPARQRQVLLATAQGDRPTEIAERLQITAEAVRVALYRGRASLVTGMPIEWGMGHRSPIAQRVSRRRRLQLTRSELERRVHDASLVLRPQAEVIPVAETRKLSSATVTLECVVCDAGMLLVLWKIRRREGPGPGIQLSTMPRLWGRTAATGEGCGVLMHPGGTELTVTFGESGGGRASFSVAVPEWDGGAALPSVQVFTTPLTMRGFAHGGLGGRAEIVLDPGPAVERSTVMTMGDLLVGLLREGQSPAGLVLADAGLTPAMLRRSEIVALLAN